MPSPWPCRVIGKLVESTGGPIQGPDHMTTARSKQPPFPDVGKAIDYQALGITNQEQWSTYPRAWSDGALLLRPHRAADGVTYLIASRIRSYLEDPEKPNGRSFVETIHATQPAATVEFSTLLRLPRRLVTEPLTRIDPDFPPLVLDGQDHVPLPPDWFEEAREMLASLVDGEPLVTVDYTLSPDVFFTRALTAAACLPGAVRWRVTIAAGVYSLPALDKGPVRYLIGLPFLSSGATTPASDSAGASYARWFAEATDDGRCCRTLQDVLELVDGKFPDCTAWDALPADLDIAEAVRPLAELRDIERLRMWCDRPDGQLPPLDHCRALRCDVLEIAEKAIDGPPEVRDVLLPALVRPDWKPAWKAFASRGGESAKRMAALGGLLGMIEPFDPAALAAELERSTPELAAELERVIRPSLSNALGASQDPKDLEAWESLLRRAFAARTPRWFARWVAANTDAILWRAVRLRFLVPRIDVAASWNPEVFPGAPAAIQALFRQREPQESEIQGLLATIGQADRTTVLSLVEHIESDLPQAALRLALEAKLDNWLEPRLNPEGMAALGDDWLRAVAAVALVRSPLDPRLAVGLLALESRLSPTDRKGLRDRLRSILGPLDSILFGDRPELSRSPVADWLWPIASRLCAENPQRQRNVLAAAAKSPELVSHDFERFLLGPVLAGDSLAAIAPPWCKSLQFSLALRDGKRVDYPTASKTELDAAQLWQPILSRGGNAPPKAPPLRRLDQLGMALCYGRSLEPFPPPVERTFWCEWLAVIGSLERPGYLKTIQAAGLQSRPFWRFAVGWEQILRLLNEEIDRIDEHRLHEDYYRAVLHGAPLELDLARSLRSTEISRFCRGPDQCWQFLEKCREVGDEGAAVDFWKHCLKGITYTDLDGLHRRIGRGPIGRMLHSLKDHLFVKPEDSDGWARLALQIYSSSSKRIRAQLDRAIDHFTRH